MSEGKKSSDNYFYDQKCMCHLHEVAFFHSKTNKKNCSINKLGVDTTSADSYANQDRGHQSSCNNWK